MFTPVAAAEAHTHVLLGEDEAGVTVHLNAAPERKGVISLIPGNAPGQLKPLYPLSIHILETVAVVGCQAHYRQRVALVDKIGKRDRTGRQGIGFDADGAHNGGLRQENRVGIQGGRRCRPAAVQCIADFP